MPDRPTEARLIRAEAILTHKAIDVVTGERVCQWCGVRASERVDGPLIDDGDYLCWQCGRWNGAKAWPDGIPGLTQETTGA